MFPHATDEVRENNDKFSPCSIKHISMILGLKKDDCFVGEKERFENAHAHVVELCRKKYLRCGLVTVKNLSDF